MVFTAVFTAVETTSREPSCFWFPTVAHWQKKTCWWYQWIWIAWSYLDLASTCINCLVASKLSVQPVTSNCLDAFFFWRGQWWRNGPKQTLEVNRLNLCVGRCVAREEQTGHAVSKLGICGEHWEHFNQVLQVGRQVFWCNLSCERTIEIIETTYQHIVSTKKQSKKQSAGMLYGAVWYPTDWFLTKIEWFWTDLSGGMSTARRKAVSRKKRLPT